MAERLSRARVVERAADLADEIGLADVTFTRLARELGVAPPALYRHAADVADLRRGIAALAATELTQELTRSAAGLSGDDALASAATTLRSWAKEHPGRYAAVQIAPDPDEGSAAAAELLGAIGSVLRGYNLHGDTLTDAVRTLRSAIHGFVSLELAGGFANPRDVEATYRRMIEALAGVLRGWAA